MPIGEVTIWRQQSQGCALGRIPLIGEIRGGAGVEPRGQLRTYGSYALMLVLAGTGRYRDIQGRSRSLNPGDLVWVFPDIAHEYGPAMNGSPEPGTWDEIYVVFGGPVFDLWREVGLLDPTQPVLHVGDPEAWRHEILQFSHLPPNPSEGDWLEELGRFQALLAKLLASGAGQNALIASPWIQQARSLLESDLAEPRSPEAIAAKLKMGYDQFRREFQQQVGLPPARYRARQRVAAAAQLLLYTQLTHRQIASQLGYRDEFYFAKCFKREMGVWPSEYRRHGPP